MTPSKRQPSPAELAAIVAAYNAVTEVQVVVAPEEEPGPSPWRFSGRWWSRPVTTRRVRPGL